MLDKIEVIVLKHCNICIKLKLDFKRLSSAYKDVVIPNKHNAPIIQKKYK